MYKTVDICEELGRNFIDFSYEANSARAFPDARDGLKPGQRACLWEMFIKGYSSNKPFVKSAKIDGGVTATWWPHGTTAIYETFARMSQDWINNIPEVDWHGNNGTQFISAEPAADRYTEARLGKVVEDGMFKGIKKNVVKMIPNFSEDEFWPSVLPAVFPRLLVNGSQGIGVTIANVWLPHTLPEVVEALCKYIDTGVVDTKSLFPSFPSGGIIINKDDVHTIYETGKGKVVLRGKTEIKGSKILITELPYQVYVEPFIKEVKELILNDEITGIDDILNNSDKKGMLIEVECSEDPTVVLKKLFNQTSLQSSYSANQWALIGKTPKLLTLEQYFKIYLDHNIDCVVKEAEFDIKKAKDRLHIVEGLLIALAHIDEVIEIIRNADHPKQELMAKYGLDEIQTDAILDMRLRKLAKLEAIEIENEKKELVSTIESLQNLLSNRQLQLKSIKDRLNDLVRKYGDQRKTELQQINITKEKKEKPEIIPEDCVVVATQSGLVKRIPAKTFKVQRRATSGIKTNDDIVVYTTKTNTVDTFLVFSDVGKMYRVSVGDIPEGTNQSRGTSIRELTKMDDTERPMAYSSLANGSLAQYIFFATKNGLIKKVPMSEYDAIKRTGVLAIKLKEGDALATVTFVNQEPMMLVTKKGMAIKFKTAEMPVSSRIAQGVKGINLNEGDEVLAALPVYDTVDYLAVVSEGGLGKKVELKEFTSQNRGGKGIACYKGAIGGAALVAEEDNVLVSGNAKSIVVSANDLPTSGRTSQGNIVLKDIPILSVIKI